MLQGAFQFSPRCANVPPGP